MDLETRTELDKLAIEILRLTARSEALQFAIIKALKLNEEHAEAFLLQFATLERLQLIAVAERVRKLRPDYWETVTLGLGLTSASEKKKSTPT